MIVNWNTLIKRRPPPSSSFVAIRIDWPLPVSFVLGRCLLYHLLKFSSSWWAFLCPRVRVSWETIEVIRKSQLASISNRYLCSFHDSTLAWPTTPSHDAGCSVAHGPVIALFFSFLLRSVVCLCRYKASSSFLNHLWINCWYNGYVFSRKEIKI